MKNHIKAFLIGVLMIPLFVNSAFAGTERVKPRITAPLQVPINSQTAFSAADSVLIEGGGSTSYAWDFDDGSTIRWGESVVHKYEDPGRYEVSLSVKQGGEKQTIKKEIFVYSKQGILISEDPTKAGNVFQQAGDNGMFLKILPYEAAPTDLVTEEKFLKALNENIQFIKSAEFVFVDTSSGQAMQDMVRWWQGLSTSNKFDPRKKTWVQISDGSLEQLVVRLQPQYKILQPENIIITRMESLNTFFTQSSSSEVLSVLENRAIEYKIIDNKTKISPLRVLSRMIQFFVEGGISQSVLYWLLAVPFLAFVVSLFRQFIGISTLGVYAPVMIALSWMVMGLRFGAIAFVIILIVNSFIRWIVTKIDLLYVPKVSMTLSVIALSFFGVLAIGVYFGSPINLSLTIFPMLMMSTISEKFLSAQSDAGLKKAMIATGDTLIVAGVGYFLVQWGWLKDLILTIPEITLIPVFGIIWLGRFTGIRLSEYFKFRSLVLEDDSE